MKNNSRFPKFIFIAYLFFFLILAINPTDRMTWFVENLTVWLIVGALTILYFKKIRFSNLTYIFVSFLIFLHTLGGHYTFANVPFDWFTNFFGFQRNHFDRLAHFTVGFYAFPIVEWLWTKKLVKNNFLLFTYPIFVIASIAMSYEIIEWVYASLANPEAGIAYLGSQGDIWDAQKDMLADTLGAIFATTSFFTIKKLSFFRK